MNKNAHEITDRIQELMLFKNICFSKQLFSLYAFPPVFFLPLYLSPLPPYISEMVLLRVALSNGYYKFSFQVKLIQISNNLMNN